MQRATGKSFLTREDLVLQSKTNLNQPNAASKFAVENDIEEAIINWQTKIFSKVATFLYLIYRKVYSIRLTLPKLVF